MKKITSKKLLNYSTISAAILATAAASGQVMYTPVTDGAMDAANGDSVDIDLNGDALVDYTIALGITTGNAMAVSFTITPDATNNPTGLFQGITSGNFQYPALLAADDILDSSSPTTMTGTTNGGRGDLNFYGCAYDNSNFCGDITDGYIGLVFDFNGAIHYGWLQLDSSIAPGDAMNPTTEGTATIKGYAFEATAGTAITIGDQGTLAVEDQTFENFSFAVNNSVLTLKAQNAMENIEIFNIAGQSVISSKLSNTTESVDLSSLSIGAYITKISIDGVEKTFKIVKR